MKTAVEWLEDELLKNIITPCSFKEQKNKELKLWEQAKEMEREQILQSYEHGQNNGYMYRDGNSNIIQAQQYYNETFKSE
jgi:hypothetical protein